MEQRQVQHSSPQWLVQKREYNTLPRDVTPIDGHVVVHVVIAPAGDEGARSAAQHFSASRETCSVAGGKKRRQLLTSIVRAAKT